MYRHKSSNTLPTPFFAFVIGGQLWGRQGAYYKIEERQRRGYEEKRSWLKTGREKKEAQNKLL